MFHSSHLIPTIFLPRSHDSRDRKKCIISFERLFLWPQKLKRFVPGCNKNKTQVIFLVTKNKGDKNPVQIILKPWPSPRIIAFRFHVTLIENMGKQKQMYHVNPGLHTLQCCYTHKALSLVNVMKC